MKTYITFKTITERMQEAGVEIGRSYQVTRLRYKGGLDSIQTNQWTFRLGSTVILDSFSVIGLEWEMEMNA